MRTPIAIAIACIAALITVDAAPTTCLKTYNVVANDTCTTIASKSKITSAKLISLNSSINSQCSNLIVGQVLCVSDSAATTKTTTTAKTTTTTKKTTTKPATTTKTTTTTKKTTTKPTTTTKKTTTTTKKATTTTKKATTTTKKTTTTTKKATTTTKKTTTTTKKATTTTTKKATTTTTKKATTTTTKKATTTTTKKATTTTQKAVATPTYLSKLTVDIQSTANFCMFMPSSAGGADDNNGKISTDAIALSEKSAVAFCRVNNKNAPGARLFPSGFIKSAHFFHNTTAEYVQVTGQINPAAYSLSTKDEGGQYDNHGSGSPPKSMCYGYKYYVGLIEPSTPDYCIRCCNTYEDCNAGRSAYGCRRVVQNGDYS